MSKKKSNKKKRVVKAQVGANKIMRRTASVRGRLKLHDKLLAQTLVALRAQTVENDEIRDQFAMVLAIVAKAALENAGRLAGTSCLDPEDAEALQEFVDMHEVPAPEPVTGLEQTEKVIDVADPTVTDEQLEELAEKIAEPAPFFTHPQGAQALTLEEKLAMEIP